MRRHDVDDKTFHWEKGPKPARGRGIGQGRKLGSGRHVFRYDREQKRMVPVVRGVAKRFKKEFESVNAGVHPDQVAEANRMYCQDGVSFDERGTLHCPKGRPQFLKHLEKRGLHSNTEIRGGRNYKGPGPGVREPK